MLDSNGKDDLEIRLEKSRLLKQAVDVFVWTSSSNAIDKGRGCGHASIQTPNHYISLWPSDEGKETSLGLFKGIEQEYIPSYEKDLELENRPPELVFRFYTLNVPQLEEKFDELKRTIKGWAAMPSLLLFTPNIESCVTIVWKCLVAGEISKYAGTLVQSSVGSKGVMAGSGQSGQASSGFFTKKPKPNSGKQSKQASIYTTEMLLGMPIKSPDYLGELLKEAKANEHKVKPLTKELDEEMVSSSKSQLRNSK